MQSNTPLVRQHLGCGYLPRLEKPLSVWQPPCGKRAHQGPSLTTCAGFTTNLPEVAEITIARAHWKVGAIVPACGGEIPTEDTLNRILILDGHSSVVEGWTMTPVADGGGRE